MQSTNTESVWIAIIPIIVFGLILVCFVAFNSQADRQRFSQEARLMDAIAQAHAGLRCPKCNGTMERGFIIDHTDGLTQISAWISGAPEVSQFGELKQDNGDLIVTFRCTKCGYVESYTK